MCIALFAVAEGWLLLDIGWFVLFLKFKDDPYTVSLDRDTDPQCLFSQSAMLHYYFKTLYRIEYT